METINECFICGNSNFSSFINCIDHTVSKEEFSIVQCDNCGFKFTNPRPGEAELEKYYQSEEYIPHSNTNKGLVNTVYHFVRKYTLRKKLRLVNSLRIAPPQPSPMGRESQRTRQPHATPDPNADPSRENLPEEESKSTHKILDIGCGTGEFLHICKQNGWDAYGIEPGEKARNFAVENYSLNVIQHSCCDKNDEIKILKNNSFDIITLWHVLEHISNINELSSELKRLLKEDGRLIIAVPNCNSLDAKIYGKSWAAYDVPRHLYHFTPENIKRLFKKINMQVERINPMKFDAFYVSMLSEKYLSRTEGRGKNNGKDHSFLSASFLSGSQALMGVLNGFRSNWAAGKDNNTFSSQVYIIKHSC